MPDVLMPRLSDTMAEGTLLQWIKHEGDAVQRGDVIAEVETDKAIMEIEAYDSGVLTRIIVEPGSTVPIGQPIAVIGKPTDATPAPDAPAATSAPAPSRLPMSPLARAMATKHGLDLTRITGTGPGGRIVRADVESAIAAQAGASPDEAAPRPVRPVVADVAAPPQASRETEESEQVPLSSIRRITAQRLTESAGVPHFYLTSVVDADALLALRADVNAALAGGAPRVSITDLLIRACAVTLRSHPQVNSSWAGDHLLRHRRVNIGCAVALDDGLIVPVVQDADRKNLTEIAGEVHELTARARDGKLTPEEFTGGTFTISNLGTYGIDHFTAVINPPEAAILAVGAAQQEAVVRDGQVVAVTTMKLTLSVDHRVVDGAVAAAFLRDLVARLEHPLRIIA
jgi:pyruvate dehydrogenase E2 component (dihydrolipoamide acetyltransferase)